jgi:hypothetical protein
VVHATAQRPYSEPPPVPELAELAPPAPPPPDPLLAPLLAPGPEVDGGSSEQPRPPTTPAANAIAQIHPRIRVPILSISNSTLCGR